MKTRSHCGRHVVACSLLAIAANVVSVAGKPYQSYTQDDYAKAVLAQYFPGASSSRVIELTPTDLSEPSSFRSSRSDDHYANKSPPLVGHVQAEVVTAAVPCKAVVADHSQGNDTSSAITVEKLTAFYNQLKGQQETLARQQFQQQLYEQQQRRQQEFSLVQQQIQQQYYQQQQHAMLMLDQMRKNPAFVSQLATFVDNKTKSTTHNGTLSAVDLPKAVPEVAAHGGAKKPPTPQEKVQTIANHMIVEQDKDSNDSGAKRMGPRQVIRQKVTPPNDKQHPVTYDDENDDGEDYSSATFEDEQTSE